MFSFDTLYLHIAKLKLVNSSKATCSIHMHGSLAHGVVAVMLRGRKERIDILDRLSFPIPDPAISSISGPLLYWCIPTPYSWRSSPFTSPSKQPAKGDLLRYKTHHANEHYRTDYTHNGVHVCTYYGLRSHTVMATLQWPILIPNWWILLNEGGHIPNWWILLKEGTVMFHNLWQFYNHAKRLLIQESQGNGIPFCVPFNLD